MARSQRRCGADALRILFIARFPFTVSDVVHTARSRRREGIQPEPARTWES